MSRLRISNISGHSPLHATTSLLTNFDGAGRGTGNDGSQGTWPLERWGCIVLGHGRRHFESATKGDAGVGRKLARMKLRRLAMQFVVWGWLGGVPPSLRQRGPQRRTACFLPSSIQESIGQSTSEVEYVYESTVCQVQYANRHQNGVIGFCEDANTYLINFL